MSDRNINYTNICVSGCRFCAFFRPPGHPERYVIDRAELDRKIEETLDLGGTQILLQGGMHPDLKKENGNHRVFKTILINRIPGEPAGVGVDREK